MPKKPNEAAPYSSADNNAASPQGGRNKKTARARAAAASSGGASRVTVSSDVARSAATTAIEQPSAAGSNGSEATPMYTAADRDEISRLAHSYWEARGGVGGSAEEDWFRAEREFNQRRKS